MSLSRREIGEHRFQYADYDIKVSAVWEDHNYFHEKTPRYEVTAYASRVNGGACENFMSTAGAPVYRSPGLLGKLVGQNPEKTNLEDLVEVACERIRGKIDSMYTDIGVNRAEDQFQARVEAEEAVTSWVEV